MGENAVTPVQQQGDCGDCWAFSTTGALEGTIAVNGGGLAKLSEQMLVDCDDYANGCTGGGADLGIWWVEDHGLCSEDGYKYTSGASGKKGSCKSRAKLSIAKGAVTDYKDVPETEVGLQQALAKQPV